MRSIILHFLDYYKTLGVKHTATQDEIKKAYRKLARKLMTLDVIEPDEIRPEPRFSVTVVERVRKMRRLYVELGVSWPSMPLVLQLLDRIDALETERLKAGRQSSRDACHASPGPRPPT